MVMFWAWRVGNWETHRKTNPGRFTFTLGWKHGTLPKRGAYNLYPDSITGLIRLQSAAHNIRNFVPSIASGNTEYVKCE